jgi:hypothetical protein
MMKFLKFNILFIFITFINLVICRNNCPKCTNEEKYICGYNGENIRWFLNPCFLSTENCMNYKPYCQIDVNNCLNIEKDSDGIISNYDYQCIKKI